MYKARKYAAKNYYSRIYLGLGQNRRTTHYYNITSYIATSPSNQLFSISLRYPPAVSPAPPTNSSRKTRLCCDGRAAPKSVAQQGCSQLNVATNVPKGEPLAASTKLIKRRQAARMCPGQAIVSSHFKQDSYLYFPHSTRCRH